MDSKLPSRIDQHVGRRIRARREELDISQQDLADRLGVTFQQLQKYEKGANRIAAGRLYELAKELKTSIAFFFPGGDDIAPARALAEERAEFAHPIDDEVAVLVNSFRSISDPDARKSILAAVKKRAKAGPSRRKGR